MTQGIPERHAGVTITEILVAMGIITATALILVTLYASAARTDRSATSRDRLAQASASVALDVIAGDSSLIPDGTTRATNTTNCTPTQCTLNSTGLSTYGPTLTSGLITSDGTVTLQGSNLTRYLIRTCISQTCLETGAVPPGGTP